MFNTIAYYLGYGLTTEETTQNSHHEKCAGDQFKISELKEEEEWSLVEKSFQKGMSLVNICTVNTYNSNLNKVKFSI